MQRVGVTSCAGLHSGLCYGERGCLLVDWWGGEMIAIYDGKTIGARSSVDGLSGIWQRAAQAPWRVESDLPNYGNMLAAIGPEVMEVNPSRRICPISDYDQWYVSWEPNDNDPTLAQAFDREFPYQTNRILDQVAKTGNVNHDLEMYVYDLTPS